MLIFVWIPVLLLAFALATGQALGTVPTGFFGGSGFGVIDRDESPGNYWFHVVLYSGATLFILYEGYFG